VCRELCALLALVSKHVFSSAPPGSRSLAVGRHETFEQASSKQGSLLHVTVVGNAIDHLWHETLEQAVEEPACCLLASYGLRACVCPCCLLASYGLRAWCCCSVLGVVAAGLVLLQRAWCCCSVLGVVAACLVLLQQAVEELSPAHVVSNIYRLLELNMLCDCVTRGCGDHSPLTTSDKERYRLLAFLTTCCNALFTTSWSRLWRSSRRRRAGGCAIRSCVMRCPMCCRFACCWLWLLASGSSCRGRACCLALAACCLRLACLVLLPCYLLLACCWLLPTACVQHMLQKLLLITTYCLLAFLSRITYRSSLIAHHALTF